MSDTEEGVQDKQLKVVIIGDGASGKVSAFADNIHVESLPYRICVLQLNHNQCKIPRVKQTIMMLIIE